MNVREIALRLLGEYEAGGKFVNLSLSSHLADNLSAEERAFLTVLLYTTVENKLKYDYFIGALAGRSLDKIAPSTRNILRLGLCQIADVNSVPDFAAVNETVKLAKSHSERSFVNGVLRAAVRRKSEEGLPLPDAAKNPLRYLSVKYSMPLGIVRLFAEQLGEGGVEPLLAAFNSEKHTDVTVNTTKISRDAYMRLLCAAGFSATPSKLSSLSIRIDKSVSPKNLPGFDEGLFFVQDGASALAAELLGVREGDLVVDTCAAPGGKSFASAILAADKAEIHSFDLHESKLSLITGGAERLRLKSVSAEVRDALTPDESLLGRADRVICDAPCSGLGVLGKKPDLRYNALSRVDELPELQYSILKEASRYLKAGGRMIYSTCTLSAAENRAVVDRFLAENSSFTLVPFSVMGEVREGDITLLPHIHGTDGFYIALLERGAEGEEADD